MDRWRYEFILERPLEEADDEPCPAIDLSAAQTGVDVRVSDRLEGGRPNLDASVWPYIRRST
jgi:hypothetical protein